LVRTPQVRLLRALALLALASAAAADTLPAVEFRSTIAETATCYRYVPTVRQTESWGARELRRMRETAGAASRGPGMPDAREFAKAFRSRDLDPNADVEGMPAPERLKPLLADAGGADTNQPFIDVGLALPAEVLAPEEGVQLLAGIPESAVKLADYVIAYTDGTMFLILNLKTVLKTQVEIDWEALLHDDETIEGTQRRVAKARMRAKAEGEVESSAATTRFVVRSTFRIVIGVSIGLLLWIIVRKL